MINTHRLLVTGKRVPYTEEIANKQKERDKMRWLKQIGIALGIILSLFLTIRKMYGVVKRHRKVHESK
ncbi:hypothetical protein IV487_11550 [Enterococcus saccharolyticus]|nr:hypothetical protein [Enterococcus saccharolyticus]